MAVDNPRMQARRELEGIGLSMESASFLVDERPSGGWESLVTKDELRADLAEVRSEICTLAADLRVEIANLAAEIRKEMQAQTRWLTGALLLAIAVVGGIARYV